MILAEKICMLRKKNGLSQEELAEMLHVSRQSISKWESAQAVPDTNKILQLSQIFGVTTDFLIKDDMEIAEFTDAPEEPRTVHKVSLEETNNFIAVKIETAKKIALATFLCIISPVALIVLGAASECERISISEDAACGIGMVILLIIVAIASTIYISCGNKTSQYAYIEKEVIETEYGVIGLVKERKKNYQKTYSNHNIIGTICCIMALVPLFLTCAVEADDDFLCCIMVSFMLVFVGIGVCFFIIGGINWATYNKLLQEEDYSITKKKERKASGAISGAYWLITTAIYLAYSFGTENWEKSWIIWPVAGVLYGAVMMIVGALHNSKEK